MRYFEARITSKLNDRRLRNCYHELGLLYEEVGKRAVVLPDNWQAKPVFDDDGEEGSWFPAYVFAFDDQTSLEEAEDIVRCACDVWDVGEIVSAATKEMALNNTLPSHLDSAWHGVSQKANLFELGDFARTKEVFRDWIVERKDGVDECVADIPAGYVESLSAEMNRAFAGAQSGLSHAKGIPIPVHYLVEGCERADCRAAVDALLEGLFVANRLPSSHAIHLNLDRCESGSGPNRIDDNRGVLDRINSSFARALSGNVVVLEYGRRDTESRYDEVPYRAFCKCIKELKPYLDSTLIVFCVPSGSADLKRRLRVLAGVPIVEVRPDPVVDARRLSEDEAIKILEEGARKIGLEPDDALRSMLAERMEDASFSDLDSLFDDWRRSKVVAQSFPEYSAELLAMLDLRGLHEPSAMAALDELIGLDDVKKQIKDILARFRMNQEVARMGLPAQPFSMHLAFLGAPGTGKTEVARLYGQILKEAGVLPEGRVVSVSGNDLDHANVGAMFDRARGSVLFVDEAYSMTGSSTIAEFIAHMENRRDDTVVILAGYEGHMNALLDRNPGFRSRLGFTLRFPEYSPEELLKIFELMCRHADLALPADARREARDLFARNGRRGDQGNARYVRKLFEDSLGAQQVRLARECDDGCELTREAMGTLLACDVAEAGQKKGEKDELPAREQLACLIGLKKVKELVAERVNFLRIQKMRRDAGVNAWTVPMHMAFLGAPGTGKTEVARLVGRILRDEGVLSVGDFYECSGSDLIVPMPGASAAQVQNLFQKARGSVIFIDEAYSLVQGADGAGAEAITELIAQMENYRDEVVVILAGYADDIGKLLEANPGFASRVRTKIDFPDYSPEELAEIFLYMLGARDLVASEGVYKKALAIMERASKVDGFGNARFARNLVENALLKQSSRLARLAVIPSVAQLIELLPEDVEWKAPKDVRAPIGFAAA